MIPAKDFRSQLEDTTHAKSTNAGPKEPVIPEVKEEAAALKENPVPVAMIQALIPLGLQAVKAALQQEVTQLAGRRYARDDGQPDMVRWGQQAGSVYLADQSSPCACRACRACAEYDRS